MISNFFFTIKHPQSEIAKFFALWQIFILALCILCHASCQNFIRMEVSVALNFYQHYFSWVDQFSNDDISSL